MQNVSFTPQRQPVKTHDTVAQVLSMIARTIFVFVLGITPLFFLPVAYAPFNFSKILFVIGGVALALIFYCLSTLRSGKLELPLSGGIMAMWLVAGMGLLSAAFSGDLADAIFGEGFGIQTAVFLALLALVTMVTGILREKKSSVMQVYIVLMGVGIVIGVYHVVRILFGPDVLTLGIFTNATASPLGGWNDLALFFGLALLLALVAIEQFPLTKIGKGLFVAVSLLSLCILAIVNFFAIWIVLGLVSLVVLMYSLTKNRFGDGADDGGASNTVVSIVLSVLVFMMSAIFIVGGSSVGQLVSNLTDISYVEVRPSFGATFDIARNVYGENMFFGTGPNKFVDAWRQYKDPAINQTLFWNTPFQAGFGYIPTFAVTTGIVGVAAWLIVFFFILRAGARVLFARVPTDRFWYFVGASSFVSALYLWGMSVMYVPGPAILLLAAFFTGLLFTAQSQIFPTRTIALSVLNNKRHGFALVALAIVVIVGSVSVLYFSGRHYTSLLSFNRALLAPIDEVSLEEIESRISSSYQLNNNDRFAREIASLQLQKMNALLGVEEPTENQRQQFQTYVANGINAAQVAVQIDPTEPRNQLVLGSIYSTLAAAEIEGAEGRARDAFDAAAQYDPHNPEIHLLRAQLASRVGDLEGARSSAQEAIRMKPDYTAAYLLAAQIDVALGNVDAAIESTRASVTLEPRNPARYYQLGVLYSSVERTQEAIEALEVAIALNPDYANARYFLALAYDSAGRPEDARMQLERVLELNPGNEVVLALLERLDGGLPLSQAPDASEQVSEPEAELGDGGEVISSDDPDSPLLSPVNTVPAQEEETADSTENTTEDSAAENTNEAQ